MLAKRPGAVDRNTNYSHPRLGSLTSPLNQWVTSTSNLNQGPSAECAATREDQYLHEPRLPEASWIADRPADRRCARCRLRQGYPTLHVETAADQETPVATPEPTVDIPDTGIAAIALAKWTGDLDGMIERRLIRVLTTYSKTSYFIDQGTPRGLVPEAFKLFEDDLNKRLKNKHVRVQVVVVPVAHDELVPALLEGRGDIVAAGKLISAWRKEQVDFTNPTRSGVSVIAVSGPGVPPINGVQDLAGREIYLRPSDAPKAAVDRFNADLAKAGKPPVRIRPAPEVLADEDMIEMVSAGLVPVTLVEDHIAEFWQQVFPEHRAEQGCGRTDRRRNRDDGAQGKPEAPRGAQCLYRALSRRVR